MREYFVSRVKAIYMTRFLIVAIAGFLLAPGLHGQDVRVDSDSNVDFSTFHRYAWKTHPLLEQEPELLQSVGAELVRIAVNQELIRRDFEPTEEEFADFFVTFFGGRRPMHETTGVTMVSSGGWHGSGAPSWQTGWARVMVRNYTEGTLVLDFVDAKTKQLAWRTYCKGAIRNPSKKDKIINKAIEKALKQFPPKP
jgi:hypothetical protein